MKPLLFSSLLISSITLSGCSKSEKDFVGTYKTYYSAQIQITDEFGRDKGSGIGGRNTGRTFNDLGEIKIELFLDQKDAMSGEGEINWKMADNTGMYHKEMQQKINFDVLNIRLKLDTLEFSIQNELTKRSGRKFIGKIVKVGDQVIIALSKELLQDPQMNQSPFFLKQSAALVFYNCFDDKLSRSKIQAFFEAQSNQLTSKIKSEPDQKKKMALENSLNEVTHRMK